jgi:hypothetical protein
VSPLVSNRAPAAVAEKKTKESPAKRPKIEDDDEGANETVEIDSESVEMTEVKQEEAKTTSATSPAAGRRAGLGVRRSFKSPTATPASSSTSARPTTPRQVTPVKKEETDSTAGESHYYRVMWCKYSRKKHKTYNDGTHANHYYPCACTSSHVFVVGLGGRRAGDQGG